VSEAIKRHNNAATPFFVLLGLPTWTDGEQGRAPEVTVAGGGSAWRLWG